jgi:hypothetical protein
VDEITTNARLKRPRAAATDQLVYSVGGSTIDYENGRNEQYDTDGAPPTKKFNDSTGTLPSHVNDLATYAAILASSSTNQSSANEQYLQSVAFDNQTSQLLNSTSLPLYATTSSTAAQLAILAQKQRNVALAASIPSCLIPNANMLINSQLRAQASLLNSYANTCPLAFQGLIPHNNALLSGINPSLLGGSYLEGSPLIMTAANSQFVNVGANDSPESKVDPNRK